MTKKEHKTDDESGFPKDSYTEAFIESQENQYNFDNKSRYDFESHAKRPLILYVVNFVFCLGGTIILGWLMYDAILSFRKENNIMGLIVATVMGGGGEILMFLGAIRYLRKLIGRKK